MVRTILVFLTATSALIVPKFGLFINLIGSFACTALAFILPVQMYNITHQDELSKRTKIAHTILMVFGTVCGCISFVVSIMEIISAFTESDPNNEQIANPTENSMVTEIDLNAPRGSRNVTLPFPGAGLKF